MQKWFRRIYAQIGMALRLVQPARYVDAPENLISISDDTGADAAGATNGISFRLRVRTARQMLFTMWVPTSRRWETRLW
jgi:hypothetical protein